MKMCPFCYSLNHVTLSQCPNIDPTQFALALRKIVNDRRK